MEPEKLLKLLGKNPVSQLAIALQKCSRPKNTTGCSGCTPGTTGTQVLLREHLR